MPLMDDVEKLKAELATLKVQQSSSQAALDRQLALFTLKLDLLSQQVAAQASSAYEEQPTKLVSPMGSIDTPSAVSSDIDGSTEIASSSEIDSTSEYESKYRDDVWQSAAANRKAQRPEPASDHPSAAIKARADSSKPTKNSFIHTLGQQLSTSFYQLTDSLGQLILLLLGPLGSLGQQAKSFYRHYQAKGMGPVFLMTLAGIITFTLGFGYLLQYSVNHWFSEFGKALLGFVTANSIIAGGVFIRQKRPRMKDFGSGIVGLGLILNYLSIFFIGPYFNIIPQSASFALLLINTLLGYGLSFKLDTKVIAIVALLGGSLAPLMLLDGGDVPLLYLPYLLLIGACSLAQSHRLAWSTLIEITAILHVACIQIFSYYLALPFDELNWLTGLALLAINGLFYLYGIGSLWLLVKTRLTARLLMVPIALLVFTIYIIGEFTDLAGDVFLLNTLVCGLLYKLVKRDKQLAALTLVSMGSFAGFGALYLLSPDLLGLILLLEGLLLLWLGSKEDFISVRAEAYVVLLLGVMTNFISLFDGLSLGDYGDNSFLGYQASLIIGMILTSAAIFFGCRLMASIAAGMMSVEQKVYRAFQESLGLLYSVTLLLIGYFISDEYCLNTLPLISILLLYLSAKRQLRLTEILAWLWLLPLLGLVLFGVVDANSLHFADQAFNVKLARVELFISLLLAYYWYKKFSPNSKLIRFAFYVQLLCYIALPLLLLPKIIHSYPDYLAPYLWLACFMALGLTKFVKHNSLKLEAQVLTVLAIVMTAIGCLDQLWQGLVALTIGALFMGALTMCYANLKPHWQRWLMWQWHMAPFYFALVVAVIIQTLMGQWLPSWAITTFVLCGYFALLLEAKSPLGRFFQQALKPAYSLAYGLLFAFGFAPTIMHSETSLALNFNNLLFNLAEVGVLVILAWYLSSKRLAIRVHRKSVPTNILSWGWHILLALNYFSWSYQLDSQLTAAVSAVLLVVHGCALMFISLRPHQQSIIRLAGILFTITILKVLFVDMASFELVQKVGAFMLIGVILLTVAYFYQKARDRVEIVTPQA